MLILTGFMGAGKSQLALMVAGRLDISLFDTDQIMKVRWGLSPGEHLLHNPVDFRSKEATLVAQLIRQGEGIISLGGGAVENTNTRSLLHDKPVVFLDPGLEVCWQRVQSDSQLRPLATDYDSFATLYYKRQPLYLSVCRWQFTGSLPPELLLNRLVKLYAKVSLFNKEKI